MLVQNAHRQPAVCSLLEDCLPEVARAVSKPVVTKEEFLFTLPKVVRKIGSLKKKHSEKSIEAGLKLTGSAKVLDDALFYLDTMGKVSAGENL